MRTVPLRGVRILDFTRQVAGAAGTRILANFGAEVLRVEWPEPPGLDFVRFLVPADDVRGINRGGIFNAVNVDKQSFTLNMATARGRQLAAELVAKCDVVCENMSAHVMREWGLDYQHLRALKEDIIYVACSGFGHTGPAAGYRSYGVPSAAHTGLMKLVGLSGRPPAGWAFQLGDTHAALGHALAMLVALQYRQRTGRGLFIDSAQTQTNVTLLSTLLLEHSVNGTRFSELAFPPGNDRWNPAVAPHNVYPCLGPDSWCAIAVFDEAEWQGLVRAMGFPSWAQAREFDTRTERYTHRMELDRLIAEWTRRFERYRLAELLQAEGVPAGVVQTIRDRMEYDPQLAARRTFARYDHVEVGPRRHETIAAKLSSAPYEPKAAAPRLGQDNAEVLGNLLGLSVDERQALDDMGVIRGAE